MVFILKEMTATFFRQTYEKFHPLRNDAILGLAFYFKQLLHM
jgi:hypothetical protein